MWKSAVKCSAVYVASAAFILCFVNCC